MRTLRDTGVSCIRIKELHTSVMPAAKASAGTAICGMRPVPARRSICLQA